MTVRLDFSEVRGLFEPDGSLIDLVPFETSDEHSRAFLSMVHQSSWRTEFFRDGESVVDVFPSVEDLTDVSASAVLKVFLGDLQINCLMYRRLGFVLDIDPSEVNERSFDTLCDFMSIMGKLLHRNIYVTSESSPARGLCAYCVQNDSFTILERPQEPTWFGATLGCELEEIIQSFTSLRNSRVGETAGHLKRLDFIGELRDDAAVRSAVRRWHEDLFHPNALQWHQELTHDEFRALLNLDTSISIVFDDHDPINDRQSGGFEIEGLIEKFWNNLAAAEEVFQSPAS